MQTTLAEVKQNLCRKYERMARLTKSEPRRKNPMNKANKYCEQVAKLGSAV